MINVDERDLNLIKKYLLLPVTSKTIEYDKSHLVKSGLKMSRVYAELLDRVLRQNEAEMRKVVREMKERGIKVISEEISKEGIRSTYLCRGYQSEFNILSVIAKAQVEEMLREYLEIG